ncbi:MAG: VWA domain-containing protein [Gammaproteobacteria bacterium]|nr:VWA domain-containing protein [Gammaproteobacteria bacterium]
MAGTNPSRQIASFVRHLRHEGFDVGIRETADALRVAGNQNLLDNRLLCSCLRGLCCRDRSDWHRFEEIFQAFWFPQSVAVREDAAARIDPRIGQLRRGGVTGIAGASQSDEELVRGGGAGRQRTLARADFRFLTDLLGQREMEELAGRLALRIRRRATRRRRERYCGRVVHMRGTFRRSLATGGLPLHLRYLAPRLELPRLVLLQDVSHSMAGYSPLLTRFARGLMRVFPRSEAFVFHTQLYRVSNLYRETDVLELRRRLEQYQHLWLGGTQIAESLRRFQELYASRFANRQCLVLIMSDGFDTDDPHDLAKQLTLLRERVRQVVWINPMLGRRDAANEVNGDVTRGLAALVDFVAPGHSLEGLETVAAYLAQHC